MPSLLSTFVVLFLLEIGPALAGKSPFIRFEEPAWTPARATGTAGAAVVGEGDLLPPVPTEAARHYGDFGEMELFRRYQMGTDTCGFASGYKSEPWTCFKIGASCQTTGSYRGCCDGSTPDCFSTFLTTCAPYTADVSTSCGANTLCCSSSSPSCYTWRFSTSASPGTTYTNFNCYSKGGIGTLLDVPPALTATTSSTSVSTTSSKVDPNSSATPSGSGSSSSSSSSTTSTSSPAPDSPPSSPTPVGAIVGGVIGGLAVIGIAAVGCFWLLYRHRRQPGPGGAAAQQPPPPPPAGSPPSAYYGYAQGNQPYGYYPVEQKSPGQPGYDPTQYPPGAGVPVDGAWYGNPPAGQVPPPLTELPVGPMVGSPERRAELGGA